MKSNEPYIATTLTKIRRLPSLQWFCSVGSTCHGAGWRLSRSHVHQQRSPCVRLAPQSDGVFSGVVFLWLDMEAWHRATSESAKRENKTMSHKSKQRTFAEHHKGEQRRQRNQGETEEAVYKRRTWNLITKPRSLFGNSQRHNELPGIWLQCVCWSCMSVWIWS